MGASIDTVLPQQKAMTVIDSMIPYFSNNIASKTDRYLAMTYNRTDNDLLEHVMSQTLPGKTVFLFSGSWSLNIDAVYVELKCFKDCTLPWHPNTVFLDPQQNFFYHYVLNKFKAQNFIILDSDYWTAHRPLADIMTDLESLNQIAPRVICSFPLVHANFNKITTSVQDLCNKFTKVSVFKDSLVIKL